MGIKKIDSRSFRRYGRVIECPGRKPKNKTKSLFRVVITEKAKKGWRIGYLLLRDKYVDKLEQHPDSLESFEPISGRGLIYLSADKRPARLSCFYLDKPVILDKGIWHGVLTLTPESEIKITENARVKCIYWP